MFGTSHQDMEYGVYNGMEDPNKPASLGTLHGDARLAFIRKVYTILSMQLCLTAIVSAFAMYSDTFLMFQMNNIWLMVIAFILVIVCQIYLLCCDSGRQYPNNMIALLVFTLAESYVVSFICSATALQGGRGVVLTAALMTAVMVIACTVYAFKTETDFTTSWGFIIVLSSVMFVLFLVNIFTDIPFLHTLYCFLGVVLFGFYLIVDTQMIMGGRREELSIDDYVPAAMFLYIDIIQIFLYILDLLSNRSNE